MSGIELRDFIPRKYFSQIAKFNTHEIKWEAGSDLSGKQIEKLNIFLEYYYFEK